MGKEVLSILSNQCRKNKFTIIILLTIFIVFLVFYPFISRFIDNASFYLSNRKYNILLSKSPAVACENEAYFIDNDFLLQKNDKIINAQGIMLKENVNYSSILNISSLSKNEIIISKSIAISNCIQVGDFINIDINYNHKIIEYKVVQIYDYLFDITEDINIFSSPLFFVGYDEEYKNNATLTYLSFYDNDADVSTITSVENIIANYQCKSRAIVNGFILTALIIFNAFLMLLGYYIFSKLLDKEDIFRIIRNSGITFKQYKNFTILTILFSITLYYLPLVIVSIISCVWSIKYLCYCASVFLLLMLIYFVIEIVINNKRINFLGVRND